jgi:hypothetical protein
VRALPRKLGGYNGADAPAAGDQRGFLSEIHGCFTSYLAS